MTEKALEARARRAARRAGLMATKWRELLGTIDNYGGFRLIEPVSNCVIERERFQLSPDDVIEICRERGARAHLNEDAEFSRRES